MFSVKRSQFKEKNSLFQLHSCIHSGWEEIIKLLKQRNMNIFNNLPIRTAEEIVTSVRYLWHTGGTNSSHEYLTLFRQQCICLSLVLCLNGWLPNRASYLQDEPELSSHTGIRFVKHPIKFYNIGMIRKKLQNVVFCFNLFIHILYRVKNARWIKSNIWGRVRVLHNLIKHIYSVFLTSSLLHLENS